MSQSKMTNPAPNNKKLFTQYDFVNEPKVKIAMPLNRKIEITSPYGIRTHPVFGVYKFHNGVDLDAHYENVYSVLDGIVTETGWNNNGGNYIKIRHFNRFETTYLHLSEIYYRVGEPVNAGFIIAKSGNSGSSTGPHLHFSVKEFGLSINPTHFLNDLIKVNHLIETYHAK
jgi:murein DD-endopeptidase MepM/ murein hydrolase activator NlpD